VFDDETEAALRQEVARLADEFRGTFGEETIEHLMRESIGWLASARVRRYVPAFAYRFTRERLRALASVEAGRTIDAPRLLFVCVRNAARSQMAAALVAHLSGGRVEAHSAGSAPSEEIDPAVIEAMREVGLDLAGEFPKPLADEMVAAADVVVTMGCGDACPLYPFKRYEDWAVEDPAGQPIDKVREVRDELRRRVAQLLGELGVLGEPDSAAAQPTRTEADEQ
jgi:arsenate reductase